VPHLVSQRPCKSFINYIRDGVTAEVEALKYATEVVQSGRSFVVLLTSFVYKRPSRHAQYRAVCKAETLYSMHFTPPKSPLHLKLLFGVFVAQVGPQDTSGCCCWHSHFLESHIKY
jgi:hypothetical protein